MMKPNDKAIEAALLATTDSCPPSEIKNALDAAYAAQFQSTDYAGLVDGLREWAGQYEGITLAGEKIIGQAADALEAALAERNWWRNKQEETAKILGLAVDAILNRPTPVDGIRCLTPDEQDILSEVILHAKKYKERDALAARLAPVEDEALRKMVDEIIYVRSVMIGTSTDEIAREVIDAIRPHIEAAERERCAKVAEGFPSNRDWVPGSLWGNIRNEIAAAIRSGK